MTKEIIPECDHPKTQIKINLSLLFADIILAGGFLVLGILGLCSEISVISVAPCYTFIGISAFIVITYIIGMLASIRTNKVQTYY